MERDQERDYGMATQSAAEFKANRTPYVRIEQLTTAQQINALSYVAGALHSFLAKSDGRAPEVDALKSVATQLHITESEVLSAVQYGEQEGIFVYSSDRRELSVSGK